MTKSQTKTTNEHPVDISSTPTLPLYFSSPLFTAASFFRVEASSFHFFFYSPHFCPQRIEVAAAISFATHSLYIKSYTQKLE